MTEYDIKNKLWWQFSNFEYKLFNVFVFKNESDFLAVSKSGYVWEVEIKVSRADFKNDFTKKCLKGINKHEYLESDKFKFKPNKFCFAVPEGLVTPDEIPDYAGLIYISKGHDAYFVRHPKFLHKEKLFEHKYFLKQMLNKFYYRHMDLRHAMELREWELKYKQEKIKL